MNYNLTDVYGIIIREFPEEIKHFKLQGNLELSAFLHYNAHNEQFIGTDEQYYHNVNFQNLDTGKYSRIFREGNIYFFPLNEDKIATGNNITVFSVGNGAKCIKVTDNGFYIEKTDLNGNITTEYYDKAALDYVSQLGLSAGCIDYIEAELRARGIEPDKTVTVTKKNNVVSISTTENSETVHRDQIPLESGRTAYSTYYEYMIANNYYKDINKISGIGQK